MKIYKKKGNLNYKEKRLIKTLENFIATNKDNEKALEGFETANNFAELQALHDKYAVTDVEFTEVEQETKNEVVEEKTILDKHNEFRNSMKETMENKDLDLDKQDTSFIDPMNREEPLVRSYVQGSSSLSEEPINKEVRTSFDEPLTFQDAFDLPEEGESDGPTSSSNSNSNNNQAKKEPRQRPQPLNPSFDDMSNAKKKRSTKKMAKYIVEVTCMLAEKGFVWYANKDINEAKLAEYDISGEIDTNLMLTLEDGTEATIKQFFSSQCLRAETLAKISEEEKSDLSDALAEVMLEKGIAPTPMQELMLMTVSVLGKQAIVLMQITAQNNQVLNQLRALKEPEQPKQQPAPKQTPPPQPQPEPKPKPRTREQTPVGERVPESVQYNREEEYLSEEQKLEMNLTASNSNNIEGDFDSIVIDTPIETKE